MITATQIRKGNVIIYENIPHRVLEFHHRTPGKGPAFVRCLLRNLETGASYERRFNSNETVEKAVLQSAEMEFLYKDGSHTYFMNTQTYEQFPLDSEALGEFKNFLKEGQKIEVQFHEGRPIGIEFPSSVVLEVVETEPELKGATASNSPKPATLETGAVVQVPPFIKQGDLICVDPAEGRYLERAK